MKLLNPVSFFSISGNSESCKLLVNAGADVNSVDKDGLTGMMSFTHDLTTLHLDQGKPSGFWLDNPLLKSY